MSQPGPGHRPAAPDDARTTARTPPPGRRPPHAGGPHHHGTDDGPPDRPRPCPAPARPAHRPVGTGPQLRLVPPSRTTHPHGSPPGPPAAAGRRSCSWSSPCWSDHARPAAAQHRDRRRLAEGHPAARRQRRAGRGGRSAGAAGGHRRHCRRAGPRRRGGRARPAGRRRVTWCCSPTAPRCCVGTAVPAPDPAAPTRTLGTEPCRLPVHRRRSAPRGAAHPGRATGPAGRGDLRPRREPGTRRQQPWACAPGEPQPVGPALPGRPPGGGRRPARRRCRASTAPPTPRPPTTTGCAPTRSRRCAVQITDRNGQVLAYTVDAERVVADPAVVTDPARTALALTTLLGVPVADLTEKLSRDSRYVVLADQVSTGRHRRRSGRSLATCAGIVLRGRPGAAVPGRRRGRAGGRLRRQGRRRAGRHRADLPGRAGRHRRARSGSRSAAAATRSPPASTSRRRPSTAAACQLTLDEDLQYVVAAAAGRRRAPTARPPRARRSSWTCTPARWRRWPSCPGYDPGALLRDRPRPAGQPGGLRRLRAGLGDEGGHPVRRPRGGQGHQGHRAHRQRPHPGRGRASSPTPTTTQPIDFTVTGILAKSSNVGAIMLAREVGDSTLEKYLRAFGIGSQTGIELPGESAGILEDSADWTAEPGGQRADRAGRLGDHAADGVGLPDARQRRRAHPAADRLLGHRRRRHRHRGTPAGGHPGGQRGHRRPADLHARGGRRQGRHRPAR